jgi:addiction module HigA family antidote
MTRTATHPTAIHPGEHIAEELEALNMSAAALARQLGVPTNRVTGILNGQRAITGDTALRLAHYFGTSAEFWLNLQSLYELRLAQRKAGKQITLLPTLKRTTGPRGAVVPSPRAHRRVG